ncbi:MAG: hypothetical protein P8Y49_07125 [Sulfurovaceae bacterium]|jgi:hypothetical protein
MEQKHSGIGIASFVISIVAGILIFIVLAIAGSIEASTPGGIDENSTEAVMIGLAIIGLLFLNVLSVGLGIGGLLQKERKKIFAILGTVFSSFFILGVIGLMVLGTMVQ